MERDDIGGDIKSGLMAYAEKEAMIFKRLRERFGQQWVKVMESHGFIADWTIGCSKMAKVAELLKRKRDCINSSEEEDCVM